MGILKKITKVFFIFLIGGLLISYQFKDKEKSFKPNDSIQLSGGGDDTPINLMVSNGGIKVVDVDTSSNLINVYQNGNLLYENSNAKTINIVGDNSNMGIGASYTDIDHETRNVSILIEVQYTNITVNYSARIITNYIGMIINYEMYSYTGLDATIAANTSVIVNYNGVVQSACENYAGIYCGTTFNMKGGEISGSQYGIEYNKADFIESDDLRGNVLTMKSGIIRNGLFLGGGRSVVNISGGTIYKNSLTNLSIEGAYCTKFDDLDEWFNTLIISGSPIIEGAIASSICDDGYIGTEKLKIYNGFDLGTGTSDRKSAVVVVKGENKEFDLEITNYEITKKHTSSDLYNDGTAIYLEVSSTIPTFEVQTNSSFTRLTLSAYSDALVSGLINVQNNIYSYQWYKNDENSTEGGTLIEGAIYSTYTINSESDTRSAGTTTYYYCKVSSTISGTHISQTAYSQIFTHKKAFIIYERPFVVYPTYYTGEAQEIDLAGIVGEKMSVTNGIQTDANEAGYDCVVSIKSAYASNYRFEGGEDGVSSVTIKYYINKGVSRIDTNPTINTAYSGMTLADLTLSGGVASNYYADSTPVPGTFTITDDLDTVVTLGENTIHYKFIPDDLDNLKSSSIKSLTFTATKITITYCSDPNEAVLFSLEEDDYGNVIHSYDYGDTITNIPTATIGEGYEDLGWSSDIPDTATKPRIFTYLTTLTVYNINYRLNGGSGIGDYFFKKDTELINLGSPSKLGYEFIGWYKVNEGDEYENNVGEKSFNLNDEKFNKNTSFSTFNYQDLDGLTDYTFAAKFVLCKLDIANGCIKITDGTDFGLLIHQNNELLYDNFEVTSLSIIGTNDLMNKVFGYDCAVFVNLDQYVLTINYSAKIKCDNMNGIILRCGEENVTINYTGEITGGNIAIENQGHVIFTGESPVIAEAVYGIYQTSYNATTYMSSGYLSSLYPFYFAGPYYGTFEITGGTINTEDSELDRSITNAYIFNTTISGEPMINGKIYGVGFTDNGFVNTHGSLDLGPSEAVSHKSVVVQKGEDYVGELDVDNYRIISDLYSLEYGTGSKEGKIIAVALAIKPIVDQLYDETIYYGESHTIDLSFSTSLEHTYEIEWYKYSISERTSELIVGANSEHYSLPTDLEANKDYYYYANIIATRTITNDSATTSTNICKISVIKRQVAAPSACLDSFVYNGELQTYIPVDFDDELMSITNNVQTAANEIGYSVIVTIKDTNNYEWVNSLITEYTFRYSISKKPINITGYRAVNRQYNATCVVDLGDYTSAGILVGDDVTIDGSIVGTISSPDQGYYNVSISGLSLSGSDASNYVINYKESSSVTISKYQILVTGITALDKVYDATTTVTLSGTPVLGEAFNDEVVNIHPSYPIQGSFSDKNIGEDKLVTLTGIILYGEDAFNYVAVYEEIYSSITPKQLLIEGINTVDRDYDGTSIIQMINSPDTSDVLVGDDISIVGTPVGHTSVLVGEYLEITGITGLSLEGRDSGNYEISYDYSDYSVTINKLGIDLTGITLLDKVYDGSTYHDEYTGTPTTSDFLNDDDVTIRYSGINFYFESKDVGNNKNCFVGGLVLTGEDSIYYEINEYCIQGNITPADLLISNLASINREYDGTRVVGIIGTPLLDSNDLFSDDDGYKDDVQVAGAGVGIIDTATPGLEKEVTVSGIMLTGSDASNYKIVTDIYVDISKRKIDVLGITAVDRDYNGLTSITISGTPSLDSSKVIGSDEVSLSGSISGNVETKNVGIDKAVDITGLSLTGLASPNYEIKYPTLTVTINKKSITVTGLSSASKTYDGNENIVITGTPNIDFIEGDTVSITGEALGVTSSASASITPYIVSLSGLSLEGIDSNNYEISFEELTATISPKELDVSKFDYDNEEKEFDNKTDSIITIQANSASGLIDGDIVEVSYAAANYNSKDVASANLITIMNISVDDSNYTLSQTTASHSGSIAAYKIYLWNTILTNNIKEYDGTDDTSLVINPSLLGEDEGTITYTSGSYNTSNVSADTINVAGLSIDNDNYILVSDEGLLTTTYAFSGIITEKKLDVSLFNTENETKYYDKESNTNSNFAIIPTIASGLVSGDTVEIAFDSANYNSVSVSSATNINVAGMETLNDNYVLSVTQYNFSGSINPKVISSEDLITSNTAKQYDNSLLSNITLSANSTSGVLSGESVIVSFDSAVYNSKNVIDANQITVIGIESLNSNYTVDNTTWVFDGEITPYILDDSVITSINYSEKEYDGTTSTNKSFQIDSFTIDIFGSETISFEDFDSSYESSEVSDDVSINLSNIELNNSNYNFNSTVSLTGVITPRTIDVSELNVQGTTNSKKYDGTTSSNIVISLNNVSNILEEDNVNISYTSATYNVSSTLANTITVTGLTSSNPNYCFSSSTVSFSGTISKKMLSITLNAIDRAYDDTYTVSFSEDYSLIGVINGDDLDVNIPLTGTIEDNSVGNNKVVTFDAVTLSGTDAINYFIMNPSVRANILPSSSALIIDLPEFGSVYAGQTLSDVSITGGSGSVAGKFSFDDESIVLSGGVNNVILVFDPTDTNYTSVTRIVPVTADYLTITFKNGDTTIYEKTNSIYGEVPSYIGQTPTKASTLYATYSFSGWDIDSDGIIDILTAISDDMIIEAVYTSAPRVYNITYYECDGNDISNQNYTYGEEESLNSTITRTGYTFAGWYDNSRYEGTVVTSISNTTSGDLDFYAKWNPNIYTITFDSNGGSTVVNITQDYNSSVSEPSNPSKLGYTFSGWYTDNNTFLNEYEFSVMPLDGITLYAKWNPNSYTVTFDSNGGSIVSNITQDYNSSVSEPSNPSKLGYTFGGWYTDNDTFLNEYEFDVMPLGGITLYAKWDFATDTPYTVNHYLENLDGTYSISSDLTDNLTAETLSTVFAQVKTITGYTHDSTNPLGEESGIVSASGSLVLSVYYKRISLSVAFNNSVSDIYNTNIKYGATPTYTGSTPIKSMDDYNTYEFKCWEQNGTEISSFSAITENTTYIAAFNANPRTYTITYNVMGGEALTGSTYVASVGKTLATTTRTGYYFDGWFDNVDYTGDALDSITTSMYGNIELYAKWNPNSYLISFESNGGSAVPNIIKFYNSSVSEPSNPSKTGYTFGGWYTDNNTFLNEYEFSVMPLEGITLYAKWDLCNYTITFDSNGGSTVSNITQGYNSSVEAPSNPTKAGYSFGGWYMDNIIFLNEYEFDVMPLNGITLYAKWNPNNYAITFDSNGGSTVSNIIKKFNSSVNSPSNPSKMGYTFGGWYTDNNTFLNKYEFDVMPLDGITLYAKWNPNQYTVYKVYHYFENDSNNFVLNESKTETLSGVTGSIATATALSITGYIMDSDNSNSINSSMILADGSLVLKVYYKKMELSIKWMNGIDTLKTETLKYNTSIVCSISNPSHPTDEQYNYTFIGWDINNDDTVDNLGVITSNMEIRAVYSKTIKTYKVTINVNNSDYGQVSLSEINNVPYGSSITIDDSKLTVNNTEVTATSALPTGVYLYLFDSFEAPEKVLGNITITASFTRENQVYKITFKNGDTTLQENNYNYGETPTYNGILPKKPTTEYTFTFIGWTPQINSVTANTVYEATFTKKLISVKNDSTGSTVTSNDGLDADTSLVVVVKTSAEINKNIVIPENKEILKTYNAKLVLNEHEVDPEGLLTISIATPIELEGLSFVDLIIFDSITNTTVLKTAVISDGYVSFTSETLGDFVFIKTAASVSNSSSNNYTAVIVIVVIVFIILIVAGVMYIFLHKRKIVFICEGKKVGLLLFKRKEMVSLVPPLTLYDWYKDASLTDKYKADVMGFKGFKLYRKRQKEEL